MSQAIRSSDQEPGTFSTEFAQELHKLFRWRRDVRSFSAEPVPERLVYGLLEEAVSLSPSVGLSQPTRFVYVESEAARWAARENYETANAEALAGYEGEQKRLYASLKLSGMKEAPVQIAAFCDEATRQGSGLGSATMTEALRYSVVCAIMQFWLATRAAGLGVGWVSIIDPASLRQSLGVDPNWAFVGYLCVGWPDEEHLDPELERAGWEERRQGESFISRV